MDGNGQGQGTPKARSTWKNGVDLSNMTIVSTPRPQATSTVERRTFGSRGTEKGRSSDKYKRQYDSPPTNLERSTNSTQSSLGILENLPSFLSEESVSAGTQKGNMGAVPDERELARKLLQRCSEIQLSPLDGDKENNANSPNLTGEATPSTLLDPGQSFGLPPTPAKEQSPPRTPINNVSSVDFEPTEITARSSVMSTSVENKDLEATKTSSGAISFGPASSDLMAQFANEDFQSGSLMSSQFLADELSFQQNAEYALPVATSTEKEHLELTCFSGIIGDLDLTVDSCAGRKVSVGEFFKRKCGNVGHMSESTVDLAERPSFGLKIRSPQRIGKNVPLVDMTNASEDSTSIDERSEKCLPNFAENTKENTIMSLSTIAQTLQDIDNGTPRRLVDQLLLAKKQRKKEAVAQIHNYTAATYTLPSCRSSMPVSLPRDSKTFENDTLPAIRATKLSLDSKSVGDVSALKFQQALQTSTASDNFADPSDYQADNSLAEILGEKKAPRESPNASSGLENSDNKNYSATKQPVEQAAKKAGGPEQSKESQTDFEKRRTTNSLRGVRPSLVKTQDVAAQRSALEASVTNNNSTNDQSFPTESVTIGKNTQELQHCIIGVRKEVEIELVNTSHRWIICALHMNDIQGDNDNVEFDVAPKVMLIPDASRTIKIGVTVLRPGKPIRALLNTQMSEMTTRSTWQMQHAIWIIPEEPRIIITTQTGKNELEFKTSFDHSDSTQTIVIANENSIDVPIKMLIVDNEGHKFRLESPDDHSTSQNGQENSTMRFTLKSSEKFKVNVRCTEALDNNKKRESANHPAKLLVRMHDRDQDILITEIPLIAHIDTRKCVSSPVERSSEHFRCETPQHLAPINSPTSPHSSASNRSGLSGRNSPFSSTSGGTVAGDVISIRATHAALVWNSIKVGKSDTKEFTIRNTSNNKIKLQASIVDVHKSFKFVRERQQVATHIILTLQRMESRSFSVTFGPNNAGPAAGRIVFKHYEPQREDSQSRPSKVIFLYGYGGTGKVEISEAFKDTGGQLWLSLGSLNSGGTLDARIRLQNTGDLFSYAKVKLTPKAVYPAMVSSWHVEPTELLLGPKEVRWVTLEFRPRKEDLALLRRANVSHVGTLTITHGDEPTRLRIRRLYKKLSHNGQMSGKENEAFRNVVYPICKVFPGETTISNLSIIRDSVENLGDLCRGVLQHQVMLTMEVNAEETMSILQDNADDTQTFYSLCSDNSHVFPATDESFLPSETLMECSTDHRIYEDDFNVSPSTITLTPPTVNEATIMIMSSSNVAQPFETVISHSDFLSVVPAEGMIPTRRGFPIRVQCKKPLDHNINGVLQVYTANDKRDVQIRVMT